jgi:hypothetical protein
MQGESGVRMPEFSIIASDCREGSGILVPYTHIPAPQARVSFFLKTTLDLYLDQILPLHKA